MTSISLQVLTEDMADVAFALATKVFVEGSTLHRALGIGLEEYRAYLRPDFDRMIAEGLSFAALDGDTGRLAGCLIATDFLDQTKSDRPVPDRFAPLAALTAALCSKYEAQPARGETLLVDMGAVTAKYAGQGIYRKLRDAAQKHARERGFHCVLGELSSATTQHVILDRMGHRKVAEIPFGSFKFAGNLPFAAIKEPPSIVLAEGAL